MRECASPDMNDEQAAIASVAPRAAELWGRRLDLETRWRLREGSENAFHSRRAKWAAQSIIFLLKAVGLYARGQRNARQPVLREETFAFCNLSQSLDGLRLLPLSDFHFRRQDASFLDALRKLLNNLDVDLCLMTGDFRFGYYGRQDNIPAQVTRILDAPRIRHGTFAVLGNHDLSDVVPGLRAAGVRVLINEGCLVSLRDDALWIGGVDDPHKFRTASVTDAWAAKPDGAFGILLAHSPEVIPEAGAAGGDLYLCGHTHGGQVRFPLFGPIHTNARCAPEFALGQWTAGAMQGFTTAGLGVTDIPVRFRCPAEALLITLRQNRSSS